MSDKKAARRPRAVEAVHTVEVEIPGTGVKLHKRDGDHPHVPRVKPYVFNKTMVEEIAVGIRMNLNLMLTGPTGCGKTTVVSSLAAQLNQPFIRFNMNGETRVSHLVGMNKPASEDGVLTLKFSEGALVEAMQHGYWVLFDEIDAAQPSVLMVLQPVLEEDNRTLFVPETGEAVKAHPEFRLFATGNTIGFRSQHRARHAGTNTMNDAFLDRFGMVLDVRYPERKEEIERVLCNVPGLDNVVADAICRVAAKLREDERFKSDFSTRRCVQWARLYQAFAGADEQADLRSAEMAVIRKMTSPTDAAVAREIIRRMFGYEEEKPEKVIIPARKGRV